MEVFKGAELDVEEALCVAWSAFSARTLEPVAGGADEEVFAAPLEGTLEADGDVKAPGVFFCAAVVVPSVPLASARMFMNENAGDAADLRIGDRGCTPVLRVGREGCLTLVSFFAFAAASVPARGLTLEMLAKFRQCVCEDALLQPRY